MDVKFRRAVVTGGAGFLGRRVCQRLLERGTDVVCVDNSLTGSRAIMPEARWPVGTPAARAGRLECRPWDVTEPFDVAGEVDLVMHLASPTSPADHERHPVETLGCGGHGTRNALELAAHKDARFVLASTSDVYGDPLISPQPEEYRGNVSPVGPRSAYDEAKRYAEALTAAYRREERADTTIARIFNTYGSGMRRDDGRMVPTFACQALRGEPLTVWGDGTQTVSLCHADDTVRGLLLLAESDLGGPINIGNPEEATVGEIAARIISLAGSSSSIRYVPLPSGVPPTRRPDILFAQLALGFEPRISWREGLVETISWFRRTTTEPAVPSGTGSASRLRPTALPAAAVAVPFFAGDLPAC